MTASTIEKLRRARSENTWLEDLKAGSTESLVEQIRGRLSDPEWDFGPAKLVSSYLTGDTKYVLAEKEDGSILRVRIEGNALEFEFGEVEFRETPELMPTLSEEVVASAAAVVDDLMNEDVEIDVPTALEAISQSFRQDPRLEDKIKVDLALKELSEGKMWYVGQLPESISSALTEESSNDKALSVLKGRVASVIAAIDEAGELDLGLSVVAEAVLGHSEKAIHLLSLSLTEDEVGRKALRVMSAVPAIDKALVFIQKELSGSESESVDQEAEIQ